MKALSSFRATVCFALDLSLIRSPASLLSQSSAVFFCLSKASGGKCLSTVHLVVGFQEPCGLEPSWLWLSPICMLPLFLVQTHPAVKLEQREGSYRELRVS